MYAKVLLIVIIAVVVAVDAVRFRNGRMKDGFLGNPKPSGSKLHVPADQWLDQHQDHFNDANTKTWKQRYFASSQFYKPGGPVFFMLGGEGTLSPTWMGEGAWVEYAKVYNAMLFSIEHRFYGKSHPTEDMSTENLQFLSSEQALADSAHFIQFAKSKYNLYNSKWISFGGSYSGSLSAWLRLKYPHLIDGAVATSAPLLAVIDFKAYLGVTRDSLATTGPSCNIQIQKATTSVQQLIQTATGRSQLKTLFNLCEDIDPSNMYDVANFYSGIVGNFEGVVQYNKDNKAFEGGSGGNITIDTLCQIMNDYSRTPLNNYAAVNSLMLSSASEKCLDFSYNNMIDELRNINWNSSAGVGGRQWTYQTCTEFGFFQTTDLVDQPFGNGFPLNFSVQQCIDIYGSQFNADLINQGINRTNTNYGAQNIKASKIVFPNGSIDQWHVLGKLADLPEGSVALFIEGTAHCANMYPSSPSDPEQLTNARAEIQLLIGQWIK